MSWKIRRDGERYYVDANTMPGAQKALRLAAAAPDLLEALEKIVRMFEGADDTVWAVEDYRQKARAAIAKAKGENHE